MPPHHWQGARLHQSARARGPPASPAGARLRALPVWIPPSNSAFVLTPLARSLELIRVSQRQHPSSLTGSGARPTHLSPITAPARRVLKRRHSRCNEGPTAPQPGPMSSCGPVSAPGMLFSTPARSSNRWVDLSGRDSPSVHKPQLNVHTTPPAHELQCGLPLSDTARRRRSPFLALWGQLSPFPRTMPSPVLFPRREARVRTE